MKIFLSFASEQTVEHTLRLGRSPYWGAFGLENASDIAAETGEHEAVSQSERRCLRLQVAEQRTLAH